MTEYLTPPLIPGRRPTAWWDYEARRPQYLTSSDRASDLREATRVDHEREVEKLGWLARQDHLTDLELEVIEQQAAEARERIGTDREQKAALSPDFGGDKLRAALWGAARAGVPTGR